MLDGKFVANFFRTSLTVFHRYYLERGNSLESLPFQELAQRLLESSPSPESIRLSEVQHTQAEIHIYTGNTSQGYHHALKALELCQISENPGHRLPQAYNEIAEAQCNLQKYSEAITNCDQAIALYLEQEGYYEHFESSSFARINKAFCLWRQLKSEEAAKILSELLEYRRVRYGPNDTVSFK
jgi:tetratricopeptide (TPR) repeat protein